MRASSQTDVMETRDGYISEALFDDGPLQTSCSPESSDSEPESITAKREKHLKLIQSAFRGKRGEQPLKSKTPLKRLSKSLPSHGISSRPPGSNSKWPQKAAHTANKSRAKDRSPPDVPPERQTSPDTSPPLPLSEALNKLTEVVNQVVGRLDKQDKRMESIEKKMRSPSVSSSSSCESRVKERVPLGVRVSMSEH